MTIQDARDVQGRIDRLEQRARISNALLVVLGGLMVAGVTWPTLTAQAPSVIRARSVIIVDDQGRDRITLAAPVPNPREGQRRSPSVGMVINDAAGYERFGLGLTDDGQMGMGFDAPPGTGDSRNRERINLVANSSGGAEIRFLNRKTFVTGRLIVDETDQFRLEFLDFPDGKVVTKLIGFKGEETTERSR